MKPTEKQENAVRYICRRLNIEPPKEYSKQSYWKFIHDNLLNAEFRIKNEPDDGYENYDDEAEHFLMDAGRYY